MLCNADLDVKENEGWVTWDASLSFEGPEKTMSWPPWPNLFAIGELETHLFHAFPSYVTRGKTPVELAKEQGHSAVEILLQELREERQKEEAG